MPGITPMMPELFAEAAAILTALATLVTALAGFRKGKKDKQEEAKAPEPPQPLTPQVVQVEKESEEAIEDLKESVHELLFICRTLLQMAQTNSSNHQLQTAIEEALSKRRR